VRHVTVAVLAGALVGLFWSTRPTWDGEMRLWKAVGDAAFVLLLAALTLGPAARLARPATRLLPWRRQLGIWFALVATLHGVLVLHGWARWSLRRFLGYEVVPQLGREVRLEPGFGLANMVGVTALAFALVLAATSSDWALRRLGAPAWKWLHHSALFVFYLSLLHAGYYLFLHYTLSFHKQVPPADWFRFPFVALGATVVLLQLAAFVKTAARGPRSAAT
jgi:sulfoxide reductase heme-binding subunit YedZ